MGALRAPCGVYGGAAQQLDAWRSLVGQTESACALVRIRKSAYDRFILQIEGAKNNAEPPSYGQMAEQTLLSLLLAWAPEKIEIVLGSNGRPSWIYEVIEQVFGARVSFCRQKD